MDNEYNKWIKIRLKIILFIFVVIFVALISRAYQIQIIQYKFFNNLAQKQHLTNYAYFGNRGNIIDANGICLASEINGAAILVAKYKVDSKEKLIASLRDNNGFDELYLKRLFKKDTGTIFLKRKVFTSYANKIEEGNYEGVFIVDDPIRIYPWDNVSSTVIGLTGIDNYGLDGLEWLYEKTLAGKKSVIKVLRDAKGKKLFCTYPHSNSDGDDIYLNLDIIISTIVHKYINNIIESDAKILSCSVLLIDINNQSLVMNLSLPSFNANDKETYRQEIMADRNIRQVFVPGKTLDFLIQNTNNILNNSKYKFTKKTINNDHYVIIDVPKMNGEIYSNINDNDYETRLKKINDFLMRSKLKIDYGNPDKGYCPSDSILQEMQNIQYVGDNILLNPTLFSKVFLRTVLNVDIDPQVLQKNVGIVKNIDIPELMENNIIILEASGSTELGSKEYMIKNTFKNMKDKNKKLYVTMGLFPINKKYYFLAVSSEVSDKSRNHKNIKIWIKIKNDIYKYYKYDANKYKNVIDSIRKFNSQYNSFMDLYKKSFSVVQ